VASAARAQNVGSDRKPTLQAIGTGRDGPGTDIQQQGYVIEYNQTIELKGRQHGKSQEEEISHWS
jgi:hypothetical protein